jgi:protein-S-isoprenylcysteine O-methyltransferase Ste14
MGEKTEESRFCFDPFGWAGCLVGEKALHNLIRVFMALVCLGFAAFRLREYGDYLFKPLWFAESFLFLVLALSYAKREPPADRARGVKRIVVPLIGGLMPFALLLSPPNPAVYQREWASLAVLGFMTLSTAFTVWGMWTLGSSFSITVEARSPVFRGPYRYVRHPIYLGEMLSAAGVALWRFSALSAAVLTLFVAVQLYRSRREEEVLLAAFPEYKKVLNNSRWLW